MTTHRERHINPVHARLIQLLGPADSWDNPLTGTKYDPVVRQHEEQERREAKQARRQERDDQSGSQRSDADHHTPDEV